MMTERAGRMVTLTWIDVCKVVVVSIAAKVGVEASKRWSVLGLEETLVPFALGVRACSVRINQPNSN
jgi:hypothetical protein